MRFAAVVVRDRAGSARLRKSAWQPQGYWFADYIADLEALLNAFAPSEAVHLAGSQPRRQCRAALRRRSPPRAFARSLSLDGFGIPAEQPDQCSGARSREVARRARATPAISRPMRASTRSPTDCRRTTPRLPRDKAEFLRGTWAEPTAGRSRAPRVRPAAPAAVSDRLPDRGDLRGLAQHRRAGALGRRRGIGYTEAGSPSIPRARARTDSLAAVRRRLAHYPRRPARDDSRCGPHAASRSAGRRCCSHRGLRRGNSIAVECGRAGVHEPAHLRIAATSPSCNPRSLTSRSLASIAQPRARMRRSRRRRWVWTGRARASRRAAPPGTHCSRAAVSVQTTPVVTSYPSQQFVVLNATGYVVAQRKAAIASKATGPARVARRRRRLAREGGRRDRAARQPRRRRAGARRAARTCSAARAALEQAQAEERDAAAQLKRNEDLRRARVSCRQSARRHGEGARRSRASPASRTRSAAIAVAEAERAQRAGRRRLHADPRAVRRRDPVEERERRRHGDAVLVGAPIPRARSSAMADMSTLEVEADVSEVEPRQDQASASRARSRSTRCPTRAFAAASAAWCRRSIARRRR